MTTKNTPRRKRSTSLSKGQRKKQTVTAKKKKKHGRENEKVCGKKLVTKAKSYIETPRIKKTPLEIAHEILLKNGYSPSTSQVTEPTTFTPLVVNTNTNGGNSIRQQSDVPAYNTFPMSSPEMLTKEQRQLIEMRRQEALAKRRRIQQADRTHVCSPVVIRPDPAAIDTHCRLHPAVVPIQEHQDLSLQAFDGMASNRPAMQSASSTHRVVTPENIPMMDKVVETEQVRPQCFWDDLEAAAEIVQWENEQMAQETLMQPPIATVSNVNHEFGTIEHEPRHHAEVETATTRPGAIASLSQELLAAAEIIQWENEHEESSEVPVVIKEGDSTSSDHELDAPQFQLLHVHVTDDFVQDKEKKELPETVHGSDNNITSSDDRKRSNLLSETKAHRKQPAASPTSSALRRSSSSISSTAAKPREEHQGNPTSSHSSLQQRESMTELIDKHLLEDKLDFSVLEFLDMMLA